MKNLKVLTNTGVNRILELIIENFKDIISVELVGKHYENSDQLVFFYEYIGNNADQLQAVAEIAKQISNTEIFLVLDDSYESLADRELISKLKEIINDCPNIKQYKIITGNKKLTPICKNILGIDCVYYFNFHLHCNNFDNLEIQKLDYYNNTNLREKKFLSLNRHARYHRIKLIDFLIREKLLPVTYASCPLNEYSYSLNTLPEKIQHSNNGKTSRVHQYLDKMLNTWQPSEEERRRLLNHLPIELDLDEVWQERLKPNMPSVEKYFNNSYFSIVTEGYWNEPDTLAYTEKPLKCFAYWHPFLILGLPYTLDLLHKDGFVTFSSIIDESYDTVEDPNKRFKLVTEEIRRLNSLNIHELHDAYENILPVLKHNYNTFKLKNKLREPVELINDFYNWLR